MGTLGTQYLLRSGARSNFNKRTYTSRRIIKAIWGVAAMVQEVTRSMSVNMDMAPSANAFARPVEHRVEQSTDSFSCISIAWDFLDRLDAVSARCAECKVFPKGNMFPLSEFRYRVGKDGNSSEADVPQVVIDMSMKEIRLGGASPGQQALGQQAPR
jgi:hypothetical protein